MVKTASTMLTLGTKAPGFSLPNIDGSTVSLSDFNDSPALLVMFICNHCPFVKHVASGLASLANDYQSKGVAVVGISSNDVDNYPQDGPEEMKQEAAAQGYTFPYLFDETQQTAKDYQAACTPDFYVFDAEHKLVYRGQMDSSRPGSDIPVSGQDLRAALDKVLAGESLTDDQVPSIGCNIKWKAGAEPTYFNPSGIG